jgi:flagellar secretion chaperone FliS
MPFETTQTEDLKRRYLAEAIETAPPAVRLSMLFDRMALDLGRADAAFGTGDLKAVNDGLVHAQEILLALRGTLRVDEWEGAPRLAALYDHLHGELVQANLSKDRDRAAGATVLVAQLAAAWRRAGENASAPSGPGDIEVGSADGAKVVAGGLV